VGGGLVATISLRPRRPGVLGGDTGCRTSNNIDQ